MRRFGAVASLMIAAAVVAFVPHTHCESIPFTAVRSTDRDFVVLLESYTWADKRLVPRIRLVNRRAPTFGYFGFVGSPAVWVSVSDDGLQWKTVDTDFIGCLTGFGYARMRPHATHSFMTGHLTPFQGDHPYVSFGTLIVSDETQEAPIARIVWSDPFQVGVAGELRPARGMQPPPDEVVQLNALRFRQHWESFQERTGRRKY